MWLKKTELQDKFPSNDVYASKPCREERELKISFFRGIETAMYEQGFVYSHALNPRGPFAPNKKQKPHPVFKLDGQVVLRKKEYIYDLKPPCEADYCTPAATTAQIIPSLNDGDGSEPTIFIHCSPNRAANTTNQKST